MSEAATDQHPNSYKERVRYYAELLNDLFDPTPFIAQERLFEFVCTLVRAGGIHDSGWDAWHESQAVLNDLRTFINSPLSTDDFPHPDLTKKRLALLSYCHLIEVDLSYVLLANLLRLQLGLKYDMNPFADLAKSIKDAQGIIRKTMPPFPSQKIDRIKELAHKANKPKLDEALDEIYDNVIRNAVYHSDYVLHENAMHLMKGNRLSEGIWTPVVSFEELDELIDNAFAFYSALFSLHNRCCHSFTDFKNAFIPYDLHYKGLMELLFDKDDLLIGFRIYWPNDSYSEYSRTEDISTGQNLDFDPDRSINLFIGIYASKPGKFSPLVEEGDEPKYPLRPGTEIRPYWPDPLAAYKLPKP